MCIMFIFAWVMVATATIVRSAPSFAQWWPRMEALWTRVTVKWLRARHQTHVSSVRRRSSRKAEQYGDFHTSPRGQTGPINRVDTAADAEGEVRSTALPDQIATSKGDRDSGKRSGGAASIPATPSVRPTAPLQVSAGPRVNTWTGTAPYERGDDDIHGRRIDKSSPAVPNSTSTSAFAITNPLQVHSRLPPTPVDSGRASALQHRESPLHSDRASRVGLASRSQVRVVQHGR